MQKQGLLKGGNLTQDFQFQENKILDGLTNEGSNSWTWA